MFVHCLGPLQRINERPIVVKGALHGALLYASATDIHQKNLLIFYWYEAFIVVSLCLGAQSLGSRLDWHGNWHRSSLALSRLGSWGNYLPFRHIRNAWDLWHCLSVRLRDSLRITWIYEACLGNGRFVPIGYFQRVALCFNDLIELIWVWINLQRNRVRHSQYMCVWDSGCCDLRCQEGRRAAVMGHAACQRARDIEREQRKRKSESSLLIRLPYAQINKEAKSRREEAERNFCGFRVGSLSWRFPQY